MQSFSAVSNAVSVAFAVLLHDAAGTPTERVLCHQLAIGSPPCVSPASQQRAISKFSVRTFKYCLPSAWPLQTPLPHCQAIQPFGPRPSLSLAFAVAVENNATAPSSPVQENCPKPQRGSQKSCSTSKRDNQHTTRSQLQRAKRISVPYSKSLATRPASQQTMAPLMRQSPQRTQLS